MWSHRNNDRHCRENGNVISAIVKADRIINRLYGMSDLDMPDDIDTCFDVDLDMVHFVQNETELHGGKIPFTLV